MIPHDKVVAVRALAAAGATNPEIAAYVRISLSSVKSIRRGRGRHRGGDGATADGSPDFDGRPRRCPHCGGLVTVLPCLACEALAADPAVAGGDPDDDLALELRGPALQRYREIRARRQALAAAAADVVFAELGGGLVDQAAADAYFGELGDEGGGDDAF